MLCYTEKVVREMMKSKSVGVDDVEGPPVPIPNTEVKLNSAEDTWRVTAWENRKMPILCSGFFIWFSVNKLG